MLKILSLFVLTFAVVLLGFFIWTSLQIELLEKEFPPSGKFATLAGAKFHYADVPDSEGRLAPVLFVHGASGNLKDQQEAFADAFRGKARMLFVDRPGYGYSERAGANTPAKQAERYKMLLDELNIKQTVLVGHSLGAASVAAFAVLYPDRVKGIIFLSPATHPWTTGIKWYYKLASTPILGEIFTETLALPIGNLSLEGGIKSVFDPQTPVKDYVKRTSTPLILRPSSFRYNARDVAGLNEFLSDFSPRYKEIKAPVIIITGDKDDVVSPSIHSLGLERDIEGAELVVLPGMGHKPDYMATDIVLDAIRKVGKL
ncbi:MAG: alpha/beta hydrolase [Rhizobiaceae bacterium]